MNKVPDTNSVDFGSLEEVRRYAIALREALEGAQDKIDKAWNRSHVLDCGGYIPGALDAWKRPVLQWLPYDFSGNPGASATQYCNGWNDSGGYWKAHADDLSTEVERLRGALTALRSALDPEDWMGDISMHAHIDAALAGSKEGI